MRRVRVLAVWAVGFSGLALVPAAAAHAAGKATDQIAAAVPEGATTSPKGDFYLLEGEPGAVITQPIKIANTNRHAVDVTIEPVDAGTSSSTGTQYEEPGTPKARTARWISVSSPQITLGSDMERTVSFTVRVPLGTKPGQYLAAMSASVPKDPTAKNANRANQAAMSLQFTFQRVIAVQINVPGPMAPKLVVTGAEPKATPDGVNLSLHIANQGNAFAHGKGSVRVASTNTDVNFPIDTFVSKTSIVMPVKWTDQVVPGTHKVQVDLQYEDGRRTSWNGDIVIAGAAQAALEKAVNDLHVTQANDFPWLLVLAGFLAVFFIAGAVTLRRRGRRPAVKYRHA
jgi:hypothetical protein